MSAYGTTVTGLVPVSAAPVMRAASVAPVEPMRHIRERFAVVTCLSFAPMFDASVASGLCSLVDAIDRITADDQD